jgi:antitoxin YefM
MAVETTYSNLRQNLSATLDQVADDREVVIVRRRAKGGVSRDIALVPAHELQALLETAHLLRSPRNASRLLTALRRAERRQGKPHSLATLKREMGLESE